MPEVEEHGGFLGFEPEDFDAYLPDKWNSNMFTLERRKVKGKLEVMGHSLAEELTEAGLSLVMHLSDEFPSLWNKKLVDTQWLFFSRDEAARAELTDLIDTERTLADTLADPTPRYRHVFLGVALNQDHLEIGLRLHHDAWVDRRNLLNLIESPEDRSRLQELLAALPEHYEAGLTEGENASPGALEKLMIEDLGADLERGRGWLFIGARLPRDQVPVLGADVTETAREVFQYLAPVYQFCAWSADNDAISLEKLVAERNEAIRASREELERERAQREVERREKQEQGLKLREEIEERYLETQAWRKREIAARRASAARAAAEAAQSDARAQAEALAAKWNIGGTESAESGESKETETAPEVAPEERSPKEKSVEKEATEPRAEKRRRERPKPRRPRGGPPTERQQSEAINVTPERAADIQIGDLVEVKKGFLKGRRGTVQVIEEKGDVKVGFGALSSRLSNEEIRGMGPAPASSRSGEKRVKRSRGDRNAPRAHFRAKLNVADGGSRPDQSVSQAKTETRESSRSREGKSR